MPITEIIDWSLALVPVLVMLAMFIWLDVFKLMTLWETLGLLLLGGITAAASYPLSGVFLDALPLGYSNYSRFAAPWVEEAIKGIAVAALFYFNRIGFKLDAVISGFAIGAGFSVIENIIYLTRFPDLAANVWMVRGLGTAVMHGTTAAILAATAHEFAERETRGRAASYDFSLLWFLPGYLAAGAMHMAFNQFPDRPLLVMIATLAIAPFLVMGIFKIGAIEAQDWLVTERSAHEAELAAWRAGHMPDSDSGRRIAALIARSDEATAARIREYCELMTWLVMQAEDALHDQTEEAGKVEVEARFAIDRVRQLRRDMGRTTFGALKPLLPFSRNDYWEVSELKERLKGRGRTAPA